VPAPSESARSEELRYSLAVAVAKDGLPGVVSESLKTLGRGGAHDAQTWLRIVDGHGEATRLNGRPRQEDVDIRNPGMLALRILSFLEAYPQLRALRELVESWQFLAVDPRRVREPRRDTPARRLSPDADNLVNVLRTLQGSSTADEITDMLQRVLGTVEEIITESDRGQLRLLVRERPFADPIEALALSDGTLRLVAICTALATMPEHGLLSIEEPEHGLHPLLFGPLLDTIRQWCPADGTRQVILTTHAPDLLDVAEPSEVVVVERDADGATVLRELGGPKLSRWLQDFRLGELWRMRQLGGVPE
jgi:predicted ATPase